MPKLRHILTGFLAGEITPLMAGRVETDQYAYGLETCENFVPFNEGPLVKRPGFMFIREAAESSTWLSAFRRGVTQEYVVEWLEQKWRFFTNGGRIETSPGVAYEVANPYPAAIAHEICSHQNFDRQYLWHGDHRPAALRRDGATSFAHEVLSLRNGPFADDNSNEAATITASGVSGTVTLTASTAIFQPGHVGSPIRLEAKDFGDIPAWEAGMKDIAIGDKCHNDGKVYQAATAGTTGQVQPTHSEGSYYDGQLTNDLLNDKGPYGVKWTYLHDRFGMATIASVASGTSATATVTRRLPDSLASVATWRWALGAFSAAAGWPHLGTLWKGRWIAFKDFEIIGSVVGDYGGGQVNFSTHSSTGVLADDLAFRRTISIEEPPLWVARDRKLILGTPSREVAIGPVNPSAALTGSNISADDQSFYGSELVWPVQFGTETIFVERGGRRIRSTDFDFARDRYDAADLTAAASHICGPRTTGGLLQLAHQRGPQALIYGVRADGQLVTHSKSRLEIKGFARTVLGGAAKAKSAVSVFGEDGRTEELWLLVERERGNGSVVKEIWKQAPWREIGEDQAEQFFVDGGVRAEMAAGATALSGLSHLAGQDVAVLANGAVVKGCSVDSGGNLVGLTADKVPSTHAYTLIVGLPYTALAVTLRPEMKFNGQSSQGLVQRVVKVMTRVIETVGVKVGVPGGALEEIVFRRGNDLMDTPIPLATGDYGGEVEAAFDRDGRARWLSDVPVNAVVAAAMLNVDVSATDV